MHAGKGRETIMIYYKSWPNVQCIFGPLPACIQVSKIAFITVSFLLLFFCFFAQSSSQSHLVSIQSQFKTNLLESVEVYKHDLSAFSSSYSEVHAIIMIETMLNTQARIYLEGGEHRNFPSLWLVSPP